MLAAHPLAEDLVCWSPALLVFTAQGEESGQLAGGGLAVARQGWRGWQSRRQISGRQRVKLRTSDLFLAARASEPIILLAGTLLCVQ